MKKFSFLLVIAISALVAVSAFGQGGGKAEANVIRFAKGKSSAVITGTLKGDEEAEYTFSARKGQTVTVTNPQHDIFTYKIFNDNSNSDEVNDRDFTFEITETGSYMFFVKKINDTSRAEKYSLTFAIR